MPKELIINVSTTQHAIFHVCLASLSFFIFFDNSASFTFHDRILSFSLLVLYDIFSLIL